MDTEHFEQWYRTRFRRRNGRNPSDITVKQKARAIRFCERYAQEVLGDSSVTLASVLTSRRKWEVFMDALDARQSTGAQRKTHYDLRDYADYLVHLCEVDGEDLVMLPSDVPPANPAPQIVTYTPEEVDRFKALSWTHGVRWGVFINYLAETGRRVGETLALEWRWFRFDEEPPYVELPSEVTKARKAQYVPLNSALRTHVFTPEHIRLMKEEEGQFTRDQTLMPFPWSYNAVHARFGRFCEKARLPNRGFHNFRHTVITERIASGMPIQAVSALAGHDNAMTTISRYAHATALDYARYLD